MRLEFFVAFWLAFASKKRFWHMQIEERNAGSKNDAQTKARRAPVSYPSFDAIRAVGIVLVMLYHMRRQIVRNAWVNIGLFFTLSGFMITSSTVATLDDKGSIDVLIFWSRRISRLFPALFLTLMAICLAIILQRAGIVGEPPTPEELYFFRWDLF